MTTVIAPGSSANLGPGFDVFGVAVARYVWAADEATCAGRGGRPCSVDHIARIAHREAGGDGDVWFGFELRPGRGLGFSAAARAAGATLARLQAGAGLPVAQQEAFEVVDRLEGHGDNAAPAVFGGMHLIAGGVPHRVAAELPGELVVWIPEAETATDESRTLLAPTVARADAVFNLGRMGLLVAALYEGRPDLLKVATQDRLHQPDRLASQPLSAEVLEAGLEGGAHGGWLSGSGPSVAFVVPVGAVDPVIEAVEAVGGDAGSTLHLQVDQRGAVTA